MRLARGLRRLFLARADQLKRSGSGYLFIFLVFSRFIRCVGKTCSLKVTDEAFQAGGFFHARDAVQVKYAMVRRVSVVARE
jgi:hypothetical protein